MRNQRAKNTMNNIDGKIYFGEMTFTPAKGTLILDDDSADFEMGEWLKI